MPPPTSPRQPQHLRLPSSTPEFQPNPSFFPAEPCRPSPVNRNPTQPPKTYILPCRPCNFLLPALQTIPTQVINKPLLSKPRFFFRDRPRFEALLKVISRFEYRQVPPDFVQVFQFHIIEFFYDLKTRSFLCISSSSLSTSTKTTWIWPPKSIKDTGSHFHSKLKEAIIQSGLEKNIFGNHLVSLPTELRVRPPSAFASDPLSHIPDVEDAEKSGSSLVDFIKDPTLASSSIAVGPSKHSESEIIEIDGPSSLGNTSVADHDKNFMKSESLASPSATTRKGPRHVERQNLEASYYADDEDGNCKKYTRRGSFRHKFLRFLLPFWSSALPTLPVTAPPRKDRTNQDDVLEGRLRHQRLSRMDPRKILLTMAIMACMATMGILYYRLAQRSIGDGMLEDEPQ